MQFKHLVALFVISILFCGCIWKDEGIWKNNQIKSSQRSDFHELDDELLKALKTDDLDRVKSLEAAILINNSTQLQINDHVANLLKAADYQLYDEYYVVNKYKDADTIINHSTSINNYKLLYYNTAREMYIALFLPKKNVENKWMICAVFSKLSYGWKLTMLDLGAYTVNGKTAPELVEEAKDDYKKNHLTNAGLLVQIAHYISAPVSIFNYTREDSMYVTSYRIGFAAKKLIDTSFVLNGIDTHPRIFKIFPAEFNNGYYPKIYYQTSIKVSDTNAIRKENNEIMKVLPTLYPGIDKGNNWLLFSAFNKLPNVKESVPRYEMDNRLK